MLDTETDTLARTIWGEARNQSYLGCVAIACVVLNRVKLSKLHGRFGNGTIRSACLYPWQFSCWNYNDPNYTKVKNVTVRDAVFARCAEIARHAIDGKTSDVTNGATYYYVKTSAMPKWAVGKTPCATIGDHLFFKDIA